MPPEFLQFVDSRRYLGRPRIVTAAATAEPGDVLLVDTFGHAITIDLPPNPEMGEYLITFVDATGSWGTHNLVLDAGARVFANDADTVVCDGDSPLLFSVFFFNGKWRVC